MSRRAAAAALALACALLLPGCATVPRDPAARAEFKANNDPLEPLNRRIFSFNQFVDRILIKPFAEGYLRVVPRPGRQALRNFLDNLNEPVVFGNTLLQGRFKDAGTTGARFVLNSTLGLAGFADVATQDKLPKQVGDFGQTLYAWGLPEGPYLVLPILGPSSPRDGIGSGVDIYLDPFRYVARAQSFPPAVSLGRAVLDGIDTRASNIDALDEMQREAVDYYASFRSFFRQHRAAELSGSTQPPPLPPSNFYNDPGA
jgi:phospholipid-binding lipoprotein MlaA